MIEDRKRAVISNVNPQIEEGRFAIKRVIDDVVTVSADIFADGHSLVAANLLFRHCQEKHWQEIAMQPQLNDRWSGQFQVTTLGVYFYKIQAWIDIFRSWQQDLAKKFQSGMDIKNEMIIGIQWIEETLHHTTDRQIKQFLNRIKKACLLLSIHKKRDLAHGMKSFLAHLA
jgi:starch synthase (maltosyl-transferring)